MLNFLNGYIQYTVDITSFWWGIFLRFTFLTTVVVYCSRLSASASQRKKHKLFIWVIFVPDQANNVVMCNGSPYLSDDGDSCYCWRVDRHMYVCHLITVWRQQAIHFSSWVRNRRWVSIQECKGLWRTWVVIFRYF